MNLLRPLPIALFLTLSLILPLSTLAAPMKNIPKPPRLDYYTKFSRASSSKSSSSSSAPYWNTIRSKDLETVFKYPETWKTEQVPNTIYLTLNHNVFLPGNESYIGIDRKALTKTQSLLLVYRTFLKTATVETAHNFDPQDHDYFVPSFQLTGSGTVKVAGMGALSISFTGERASTKYVYRRIIIVKDKWLYTLWLNALPQYAEEDGKVFDGVVGSFTLDNGKAAASSISSRSTR